MREPTFNQIEIVESLLSHDAERRKMALHCLFSQPRLSQMSINHVCRHGGNRQDGEDVFQEAIILFDRKTREGHFRGEGELEAFFMGIVRWHWFNTQNRKSKRQTIFQETPPEPEPGGNPETEFLQNERSETLEKLLGMLNEKCRNLLKMYQLDYSMEEIATNMGYANAGVAKKEAFLCRQRFRVLLKNSMPDWATF